MMKVSNETINYLLHCDFFADTFDPEDQEEHLDAAEQLLKDNNWSDVFAAVGNYLYKNCLTAGDIINFVNLYVYYGFAQKAIPEPIKFISYLYYMVDMDKYWDEVGDLFDGVTISVFTQAGLVNMMQNPYYSPLKDQRILTAIEKWKSGEYNLETDPDIISAANRWKERTQDE